MISGSASSALQRLRGVIAIWAVAFAFVAAACAATLALIERGEHEAIAETEQRLSRFVRGAEASLNRTLIGVDVLLADMRDLLSASIDAGGRVDPAQADRALPPVARRHLELRDLIVVDRDGGVVSAARSETRRLGVPLPAGFAQRTFAQATPALAISEPVLNFATSERVLFLARPLDIAPGRRVLVVAELPLSLIGTILAQAAGIPGLEVTLERADGQLLASVPPHDIRLGERIAEPLPDGIMTGRVVRGTARLEPSAALLVGRPALYTSVRLVAGLPLQAALAPWHTERNVIAGVAAVFIAMILAAAAAAHWQLGRLSRGRRELAQAKAIMDRALSAMADGFILYDAQDRVVAWNERYLEMFPWLRRVIGPGVSFERFVEIAACAVVPDDAHEAQRQAWREHRLDVHRSGAGTYEQELPDGAVIHVIERRTPDGGIVSVCRDITAAERELQRATLAAEAASRAKSHFLAAMSHEIRTPLNGVLGVNNLLLQTELSDQQRGYARTIRSSGKTLLTLINDILDLSKIEAGRLELVAGEFDPRRIVEEVAASLTTRADEQGLALNVRFPTGLSTRMLGDENRLRQVLFNLIGNAVKFTHAGSVDVCVAHHELDADADRIELDIAVRDTGIGIARDVLPTLFERFTQADSGIARRYGGSGLGLAISRELVELMGGRIAVDSELGKGSTFRVTLALPRVWSPAPAFADSAVDTGGDMAGGLHILVAEDNEVNQIVVRAVLARLGHSCDVARDGREAVRLVEAMHYDLVLMDIQMPNLDGIEATRQIRASGHRAAAIPIVALTANAMVEERDSYLAAGMDGHVAKPIEMRHLADAIARVMADTA